MGKAAANIALAWMSGLLLGIGLVQEDVPLIAVGAAITLISVSYYRSFVRQSDD